MRLNVQLIERCKVIRRGFETVLDYPINCHILLHTLVNLIFILSQNIFGNRDIRILSYLKLISEISHKAEV